MILITTQCFPPDLGGIENLMAGLADHLAALGPVRVFADGAGADEGPSPAYQLSRFGGPKPLRRWLKARAVAEAARQPGVRGLFADSWKSIETLPALKVPIVVLAHGAEFPVAPSLAKRRRIERALSRAHRILASSAFTAERVRAYAPGARIAVIHPPIGPQPAPSLAAQAEIDDLRQRSGPLLATVSRLEPRKGIDRVITAVADLIADHPDIVYAVAGGGADLPRLQTLASDLGIAERVRFLGRIGDYQKAALLAAADVFAMPTRRDGESVEGFGIIYLEAAWHGLAAIAGREGGGGEAVANGVSGLVVDGDDQAAVTEAVRSLVEDAAFRKEIGQAAAARVRQGFLWDQATRRYLAALS